MRLRAALILLLLPLLFACKATNPYDPVPKELALTVRVYEDVVRWRELHKIYRFGKADADWQVPDNLANVRVTGYEASEPAELSPWRWGQTAVITYVLTDRQVVRQLVDQQIWASDNEGKSWYRVNPPPSF